MVLIRFRFGQNKFYKIELEPTATISQARDSLSKEIGSDANPSKINLLYKAKLLKDDQTIESLKLGEKDYILVHTVLSQPKINYGPDVYPVDSPEAYQILQEVALNSTMFPPIVRQGSGGPRNDNTGDNLSRIFRRALQIEPAAIENVISIYENVQPNVRQHLDTFLSGLGLNPGSFNLEAIRNRTEQPLNHQRFGMLLAQTCLDLGINPNQFMNFPGSGAPPFGAGGIPRQQQGSPQQVQQPPQQIQQPPQQIQQPPQNSLSQIMAQFSPEEREAIQRLQQLGNFPIELVVQMFIAADKNENVAANLLFGN